MSELPDSLRILACLRQLDESGFIRLLRERNIPTRGLNDPIDLAEWLTADTNISTAMHALPWHLLCELRREHPAAMRTARELQLALPGTPPQLLPHAAQLLPKLLPQLPNNTDTLSPDTPTGTQRAQEGTQFALDVLWQLTNTPRNVHYTRSGNARFSAIELRRLALDVESTPALVAATCTWLRDGGLIAPIHDAWAATKTGHNFPTLPLPEQWLHLAQQWRATLTRDDLHTAAWLHETEHPAGLLGLADPTRSILTQLGARILDSRDNEARELLATHLTPTVPGVYLQPDHTIIAPGPLQSRDDATLRQFSELEHRATATQYRLTQTSIERALAAGIPATQIHAELAALSLTDIPQPVAYLLDTTAERFGQVRVRTHVDTHGRLLTQVRANTPQLLDALRIDTSLSALALHPTTDALETTASAETTLLSLLEAHYPAALETPQGQLQRTPPPAVAPPFTPRVSPGLRAAAQTLVARIAETPETSDGAAWRQRRLELARREHREVRLEISLGGGHTTQLELIPVSVNEQRLRALDLQADVERTIPLRAITAIEDIHVAEHD